MKRRILSLVSSWALVLAACAQSAEDPNEGSRLIPLGDDAYAFTWWARAGSYYLVDVSDDLTTWNYLDEVMVGLGGVSSPVYFYATDRLFVRLNTDPFNTDRDGDGLPDGWEVLHGLNPGDPSDALSLAPGGITYLQKYLLGLNPDVADTDGDGADDGTELANNTDANSDQSHPPVWRTAYRQMQYDFDDYPADQGGRRGTLYEYPSWDAGLDQYLDLSSEIAWTALSSRLTADLPFPDTKPSATDALGTASGSAGLIPDPPCYHAMLYHERAWLEVKPAATEAITKTVLKVTERTVDQGVTNTTVETLTVTIAAGQTLSPSIDLTPAFTTNPTGNTAHSEQVTLRLLPVEVNCPELYMFSGHSGDKVELSKVSGIVCEWKLKTAVPAIGTFNHPADSACSFTATAPGKNAIQLLVGGNVAWEKPIEVQDLKARTAWGAEAVDMSGMSGVMRNPPTTGPPLTQILGVTYHHSANAGDGVAEILRIQREHKAEGFPYNLPVILGGHENWGDIGYHFVMTKDGTVYVGRELEAAPGTFGGPYTLGADVKNNNTAAGIGICMLGNYDTEAFSQTHQKNLEKVLTAICRRYKLTTSTLSYHAARSVTQPTTHCPGANVIPKSQEIADHVRQYFK